MALEPEDKKKIYLLAGVAGVLGIAGLVLLRPSSDSSTSSAVPVTTAASSGSGSGSAPASSPDGFGGSSSTSSGGAVPITAAGAAVEAPGAQLVSVSKYRPDPFTQFYTKPPPLPPVPPPPPKIPPPLDIPAPPAASEDAHNLYALPSGPGGAGVASQALVGLPSARIPRLVNVPTAPRIQVAPPSQGGGSQPALERSGNKRLAGVVIGDSVRALLEVQDASATSSSGGSSSSGGYGEEGGASATPPKTYIVQPGQEIPEEGIKVLRIERTNENGQTRVRMIVLENGVTRYIDLREGTRQNTGGGEGGYPGSGSSGGGYPGSGSSGSGSSSGGYPGAGFRGGRPPLGP